MPTGRASRRVSASVAACVSGKARRPGDSGGTLRSEELCILLPGTDDRGALTIGEGVRLRSRRLRLPHEGRLDGVSQVTATWA